MSHHARMNLGPKSWKHADASDENATSRDPSDSGFLPSEKPGIGLGPPRRFRENILIGISLLLIAWITVRFDVALANFSTEDVLPGDLTRILRLSEIFAHGFGLAILSFGIWSLLPERRRQLPRLLSCAIFPPVTAHLIKIIVGRRRPTTYLDQYLVPHFPDDTTSTWSGLFPGGSWNIQYATQSFPSAHAALVCGLAIGMSFLFPRGRWLFVSLAVLASFQRIASNAHWASDVLVGAALGFIIAGGLVQNWGIGWLCGRWEAKESLLKSDTAPSNNV